MDTVLIILCIVIIALVLLQSGKAEGASQIITGGAGDLFKNRKEGGIEVSVCWTSGSGDEGGDTTGSLHIFVSSVSFADVADISGISVTWSDSPLVGSTCFCFEITTSGNSECSS